MKNMHKLKVILISSLALLMVACAGKRNVPFTVQSDPLGAYVHFQVQSPVEGAANDWVFLGKTPVDIKRFISKKQLKKAGAFRLSVQKEGFSTQVKHWTRKEIDEEIREKGTLYWNPKLVPNQ